MFDTLPNFMILGVAKAGTTSLYHYLQQHPAIYLSDPKEPHFFDQRTPDYLNKLDFYLNECFAGAESFSLRGEATPSYFSLPELVAPRIHEFYKGHPIKFVVILRDPVARAWSHYLHRTANGNETETFARALELEPERLRSPDPGWVGYFSMGLYAQDLKYWLKYFDMDQFLFILTDDLSQAREETIKRVVEFLGADPTVQIDTSQRHNQASYVPNRFIQFVTSKGPKSKPARMLAKLLLGKYYGTGTFRRWLRSQFRERYSKPPQMDPMIEQELRQRYAEHVQELSALLGRDLSNWLPPDPSSLRNKKASVA
jgi:hypothetical protein